MSGTIGLDLRYPIGALFVMIGVLLAGFGLLTAGDVELYARAGGWNVNLWWGVVMSVVGCLFLLGARRGARADAAAARAAAS